MFVALKSSLGHTHIDLQSLHGVGPHHHLIEGDLGDGFIQFAVDRHVHEVFWTDSLLKKITWTDYTGMSKMCVYIFLLRIESHKGIKFLMLSSFININKGSICTRQNQCLKYEPCR